MNSMKNERHESEEEAAVADALRVLGSIDAVVTDPTAIRALSLLQVRFHSDNLSKSQRLARAAHLVNASLDIEATLRSSLELAVDVMNAERGFLVLREGRRIAAVHNIEHAAIDAAESLPPRSIVERVFETRRAVFTTDAQADPSWNSQHSVRALHLRSIACVPLSLRDDVLGVVYLDSRVIPGLFEPGDRDLLASFAFQAALAIENSRIFEGERDRVARISALQAFQARILEAIANGVITLSPKREISTFNRSAERTLGVKAERMNGKAAFALAAFIPDFPELLDTFFSSGAVALRAEVDARRANGERAVLELALSPLESPEGKSVVIVVSDTTKQRSLEIAQEEREEKDSRVREAFSRYLAPHVVQTLLEEPDALRLGGERKRATMLFADIRGFTRMAADLPAERVVEILNVYFEEAVRIVFAHDGLLDKFYGDGLLAVFGPPLVRDDDATRAIHAAIGLVEAVGAIGPRIGQPISISIGLATGEVVAGHVGSAARMDYTVVGDAVNLANGLQQSAPPGVVYFDEATALAAGPLTLPTYRLAVAVKGRGDLVTAHAVVPVAPHRLGPTPG